MLKKTANVDASYGLSPDELKAKVALSDALIVRSATKVCNTQSHTQTHTHTHTHTHTQTQG